MADNIDKKINYWFVMEYQCKRYLKEFEYLLEIEDKADEYFEGNEYYQQIYNTHIMECQNKNKSTQWNYTFNRYEYK